MKTTTANKITKRDVERGHPSSLTVLHVFSGDLWAGAEVMIFNLFRELKDRQGLTMIALALNDGLLASKLRAIGIETHVLPESGRSFPGLCRDAIRLFRHRSIDIVHAHRYKENLLAWIVAKALGVSSRFSTIHGMPEWHGQHKQARIQALASLNLCLLKRGFSKTVAVSHEIERTLHDDYGFPRNQLAVIHNGVPLPQIDGTSVKQCGTDRNGKTLTIGTIGRLVPVKGFDLFLDIAAQVLKEVESAKFAIVGDGPEKENLERLMTARGLHGHLDFLPFCPDPSIYYRSFDVFLNTSFHEGIPLTILEAMAWAKPVIAAKVGGIPEIIDHEESGILVEGRAPSSFARWCVKLANDEVLRTRLGTQARGVIAARFSVEGMADSYAALYEQQPVRARTSCIAEHVAGCR